jgi:ABC-type Mn2+/Zn2+ transport system ATPase subunit
MLTVRHLTVSYGGRPALRDVSFTVQGGERVAIVGPNGAGKSTLLKAIVGLTPVDAGAITVDGSAAVNARSLIAYLAQSSGVDPHFPATVWDVVATGRWPRIGPVKRFRTRDRAAVWRALDQVGLVDFAAVPIAELSGGQRQRMLVARALCQQAALLLLDEPYVGIDGATERLLVRVLADVAADGVAVVVVHHDLATLSARYPRMILLNRRLVADGAPTEVLRGSGLASVYQNTSFPLRQASGNR